jgi:anti-sigma regulatory factor (Ser/Thr protein kinase)
MEDLSLHILDIAENAIAAGAQLVEIIIELDTERDRLQILIRDNGRGMDLEMLEKAGDPFFTTRTTRRVGLGLSLLQQAAQEAAGEFFITSKPGQGTEVRATFQASHIDRKPLGDMGSTLVSLILGNPDVDFIYESNFDGEETTLDTRMIKAELDDTTTVSDPAVLNLIKNICKGDRDIGFAIDGGEKNG